jgi:hypothetical protein
MDTTFGTQVSARSKVRPRFVPNSFVPSPIEIGFRHVSHKAIVAIYGHVLLGFASFSWLNQCRIALLDHLMLEAPFPARFVDTTAPAAHGLHYLFTQEACQLHSQ